MSHVWSLNNMFLGFHAKIIPCMNILCVQSIASKMTLEQCWVASTHPCHVSAGLGQTTRQSIFFCCKNSVLQHNVQLGTHRTSLAESQTEQLTELRLACNCKLHNWNHWWLENLDLLPAGYRTHLAHCFQQLAWLFQQTIFCWNTFSFSVLFHLMTKSLDFNFERHSQIRVMETIKPQSNVWVIA